MEGWLFRSADHFWNAAGLVSGNFRTFEESVSQALPLTIVKLPRLGILSAERVLRDRRLPVSWGLTDRPLRACCVAYLGEGIVLIDGCDPSDEQRFSLAHEVAHFILDYVQPRDETARAIGEAALDVLDGRRPARPDERIDATLAGVWLEKHRHFLDRDDRGGAPAVVRESEWRANLLAFEFLAPEEQALPVVATTFSRRGIEPAARAIEEGFRLPRSEAEIYTRYLVAEHELYEAWLS